MTTPEANQPLAGEGIYAKAVMFATRDKPSCSYIQRRMQIGYNEAAALMERMEAEGLISKPDSAARRTIILPWVAPDTRPAHPEPERDGADPWETGADAICAAMIERSAKSIKRVSEDLYETMMIDVQDWLRENVTYNLSSELSRRDHAIASLKALLSTAERQRDEAVRNGRGLLRLIDETDEHQKWPDSGAWGVECACCMGELFDGSDRVVIEQARQALQSIRSGE